MSYSPDTSSIELEQIPAYPPASLDQDLPGGPYEISFSVSHNIGENEYGIDFSGASSVPLSATSTRGLNIEPENAISLPPMDGGFHAFAYLASAWFIEFLVWSPPFSYGVFLNFYTTDPDLKQYSSSSLALVGSMASGVLYLSSPVVLPIINRFPRHKRTVMILGILLCVSGLIGAAFSTKIWHLIITQGFMYSLGGSLLYFPTTTYLFEWFSQKRGIANGVMYSGTGVGGVVTPFVIENLLSKYGRRTTLLSLAFAFLFLSVPCLPFNKPRVPVAQVVDIRSVNTGFLKYSPFWILFMANLSQGLASFLPSLYLPTFASDLSLGTTSGTLALSFINGASVPGLIFLGWLSDLLDVRWSILLSSLGSALAVFLLWGFAETLLPLLVFACIYGFLAPSWCALWPRFVATVDGDDPRQASILMSILFAGRGIGNVLAAPIASGLLHPWNLTNKSRTNYGFEGYGPLIIFTGLTLLVSSMGTGYRILERRPISSLVGE
ncbi:major facilitator superfamily domain-containing protein [Rhodocollybia butyracea]|uniref:Major facilitator superfamily domain-containing protein n=1 Tax=Rhodocollybia butyracea TaxID=206335 RepID=A0A9P5PSF5_9AGAR|nr:major facilitator superfamily domain-containing protein [Rhodocollybia butyracea]